MKIASHIDQFGTAGLILTAIFSPCCFPLFAFAASLLGLGTFELFGGWTMWIFQALVLISLGGLYISYRNHHCTYPLLIAIPGSLLIFYGYYLNNGIYWIYFLYVGMLGLMIATGVNFYRNKLLASCETTSKNQNNPVELQSILTCPDCGHKKNEKMPVDACVYFYECEKCKSILKPLKGDCCVFCSYGTVKCPSIQMNKNCC